MLTASTQNSTPFLLRLLWWNYLIQKTITMTYKRSPKSRTKCTNDTRGTTAPRKPNIMPSMMRILIPTQLRWTQIRSRLLYRLPNLNSRPIRQPQKTSQGRHRERQCTKGQHRHRLYAYNPFHPLALALRHRHRHPDTRSVTNLRGR